MSLLAPALWWVAEITAPEDGEMATCIAESTLLVFSYSTVQNCICLKCLRLSLKEAWSWHGFWDLSFFLHSSGYPRTM